MNQLGLSGAPVPGSLLTPDPPEETRALAKARQELALAEAAHSDQHVSNDEEVAARRQEALEGGRTHEPAD
jgi:ubiquinol-cytochrome c reductase cytochrome b subunit